MAGSIFVIREAAVRPRPGQNVLLSYHEHTVRGRIESFVGDTVRIRPDSALLLRQLRQGCRLSAQIMTGEGTLEATLSLMTFHDHLVAFQLVGLPSMMQRRGHPRIPVRLDVTIGWMSPRLAKMSQVAGTTQNLSLGGTLVRFPTVVDALPRDHSAVLLEIDMPQRRLAVPARVLGMWDSGARLRFLDLDAESSEILRLFIEPRLT